MTEELRCYTWTLYQLSSIQQGIQAGHAAVELTRRGHDLTMEWAKSWKTLVCLNGGDLSELHGLIYFFSENANPFPWTVFYESIESLDGIPTSVAMIVPARIFELVYNLRKKINLHTLTELEPWELQLVHRMADAGLAR